MRRPRGQHFLYDKNILRKIISCSDLNERDTVVEIGPGPGTLTHLLADRARRVVAIEIDRRLAADLQQEFADRTAVEIVCGDALKFPYESIEEDFKVIANIPYYISTPLLFRLLAFRKKIPSMTLLLQKEVARRITASPGSGEYGVLSISVQLYAEPSLKMIVPGHVFVPPPDVDSAVVYFSLSAGPRFRLHDEELFHRMVKTAFSQRRKTLLNGLKAFEGIGDVLEKCSISPRLRPENLGISDFVRLANTYAEKT